MAHLSRAQLEAGEGEVTTAPSDAGTVDMVVRRPAVDEREVLEEGRLVTGVGLEGDNYLERGSSSTPDGAAHPEAELTVMNSRAVDLVAGGDRERWPLAGDQLFADLDLSVSNLPAGTRLAVGDAVIEVTAKPHTGCAKFAQRFGIDAARWVNSSDEHRFRGVNARVVTDGTVRPGDTVGKL